MEKPTFVGLVRSLAAQILNADSTNLITLWTPGASGSKINALGVSSTDTSNCDIALYVTKGGVDYLLGTIQIPLSAGDLNNTPAIDLLGSPMLPWVRLDADGSKHIHLEFGAVLKAKAVVQITAAKAIQFFGHGGDY